MAFAGQQWVKFWANCPVTAARHRTHVRIERWHSGPYPRHKPFPDWTYCRLAPPSLGAGLICDFASLGYWRLLLAFERAFHLAICA